MKEAFIVSAVRTPVGKAPNGRLRTVRPDPRCRPNRSMTLSSVAPCRKDRRA